ncbi:hypothetical protein BDN72DRAFT_846845 [Pluteus cervinus]|uniref:Uncharacterized protein n=1 Tax=Pluteus cervinus TaxID=181527 RepID=A0ACD3AEK5_9AGAR|nr:hypothetical protein BDN72DRAFT_846845 [Pluteus cervinus]
MTTLQPAMRGGVQSVDTDTDSINPTPRGVPLVLSSASNTTSNSVLSLISSTLDVLIYLLTFGIPYRYNRWYKNKSRTKSLKQGTLDAELAMTWMVTNGISTVFIGLGATLLQIDDITCWDVARTTTLLGLLFAFSSFICGWVNYVHRNSLQSMRIWEDSSSTPSALEAQQKDDSSKSLIFWILITLPTSLVIWSIIHLIGSILLYSIVAGQPQHPTTTTTLPISFIHNVVPLVVTLILTILLSIVYAIVLGGRRAFDSQEHIATQHVSAAA